MPRRRAQPHPSTQLEPDEGMGGFPQDGDDAPDDTPEELRGNQPEPRPARQEPDPWAEMRSEMAAIRAENAELRRAIPPVAPAPPPPPEEEPDWETMLFQNPAEALRLHGERVRESTKRELRAEYQAEQGTQKFWEDFYNANTDLHEDHDLVNSTLQKHLPEIANMPVSEAMERLADLTRQRIMKYSKRGGEPRRTRAIAEGANSPTPRTAPAAPDTNVTSLSSLIKARRAKRRGATAA